MLLLIYKLLWSNQRETEKGISKDVSSFRLSTIKVFRHLAVIECCKVSYRVIGSKAVSEHIMFALSLVIGWLKASYKI